MYVVYYSGFAPPNRLVISTDDLIFPSDLNFHKTHQINPSLGCVRRQQKPKSLQFLSASVLVEMREPDPSIPEELVSGVELMDLLEQPRLCEEECQPLVRRPLKRLCAEETTRQPRQIHRLRFDGSMDHTANRSVHCISNRCGNCFLLHSLYSQESLVSIKRNGTRIF